MNRIFGKRGNKMYALTVNNLKQLLKKKIHKTIPVYDRKLNYLPSLS